ncbi:MAG: hypothetical protein AAF518_23410 [Spirochaetota bacterium]
MNYTITKEKAKHGYFASIEFLLQKDSRLQLNKQGEYTTTSLRVYMHYKSKLNEIFDTQKSVFDRLQTKEFR